MTHRSNRIACLELPELRLQVLRRDRPEWNRRPLAVVAHDDPRAPVIDACPRARARGVRIGMRYATALALVRDLGAAPVAEARVRALRDELVGALREFTPRIEPDRARIGVIWLDPTGMLSLFGTLERWARALVRRVAQLRWRCVVVVGFSRLPSWIVARALAARELGTRGPSRGVAGAIEPAACAIEPLVLSCLEEERARAAEVSLASLDLPLEFAQALQAMGVRTVGELLAIPRAEIATRFGPEIAALHAELDAARAAPFAPAYEEEPLEIEAEVDPPTDDEARLIACVRGAVHALMRMLECRRLALAALHVSFVRERGAGGARGAVHEEFVQPARATRDVAWVVELVRLRLALVRETWDAVGVSEGARLKDVSMRPRIASLRLRAESAPFDAAQLVIADVAAAGGRDPDALARGIARLRAALGDGAVTVPRLVDDWAPERAFRWDPAMALPAPRFETEGARASRGGGVTSLGVACVRWLDVGASVRVRRIVDPPRPLEVGPDGRPCTRPALAWMQGPHRLRTAWWRGTQRDGRAAREGAPCALARDYYLAGRADGAILWIYKDAGTGRWFLHGFAD